MYSVGQKVGFCQSHRSAMGSELDVYLITGLPWPVSWKEWRKTHDYGMKSGFTNTWALSPDVLSPSTSILMSLVTPPSIVGWTYHQSGRFGTMHKLIYLCQVLVLKLHTGKRIQHNSLITGEKNYNMIFFLCQQIFQIIILNVHLVRHSRFSQES